jgi:hypothetical protein
VYRFTTRRIIATALIVAPLALFVISRPAMSHPEPKIITEAWEFDFTFKQPRVISVKDIDGMTRYYWYLPYTVTNNTGEDRLFVPHFAVLTDAGHLISAGRDVDPTIFAAVYAEQRDELLESPVKIIGRLLQGEDNARSSVAIWQAPEQDVDKMWVFIAGLSGETAIVDNPVPDDDPETDDQTVVLRKTLMIEFETPGTIDDLRNKPVVQTGKKWIMR